MRERGQKVEMFSWAFLNMIASVCSKYSFLSRALSLVGVPDNETPPTGPNCPLHLCVVIWGRLR